MAKHAIIIGGGMAGLSAANALLRGGCAVTLLEAKSRLGGRIHTIRENGLPVELGAEFLHGQSKTIQRALESARLTTHEVSIQNRLFENGKFTGINLWEKMSRLIHRINPRDPDCSFLKFLDAQDLNATDRAQAISFVQGFHAALTNRIGAHALLRGEIAAEKMEDTRQGRVNEGYSALVDFLATEIRSRDGKILDGAEVKTVRWKRRRVEVFFLRKNRAGRIDADVAIVTLSLGVLKSGTPEFDPPLTHKLDAIRELQFGNVAKIIFVFREEWWPEKNFGFVHALDEPIPTWWSDPRGPMITGWAGGPKADALANFSPTQLEQLGLEILEKIFSASSLRKKLLAAHTYNWAQDPYVLGAYSYIPPNGLDLPKLLGAPVDDTLFFAGEATATDAQMGTVFSAFDSGERAAREVLR